MEAAMINAADAGHSNTCTAAGPPDWPPVPVRPGERLIAQWPRLAAGRSDDLGSN